MDFLPMNERLTERNNEDARLRLHRLQEYWGPRVKFWLEERTERTGDRVCIEYDIRSDMIGGLPRGYKGPLNRVRK